jgi:hypothetical protein
VTDTRVISGVSKKLGEWYHKTKKNRRYKQINFIGLQSNRHTSQHTVGNVHKASGMAAIQEHVTAGLRSIPKEAFADSFQKLYERCQPCVVKDGDYFEGQ